ncbi:restriction endonuclease subunit S [Bartonella sp. DGB1]|uniref:restriction endonuclease subunit S n=1 Tax=Bartonella sp. DGB1 TaxID=3239807 RepID=UPI0035240C02
MEKIKAGYKQTDIGLIPADWQVKPISALCDIFNGTTPSTANPAFWFKGDIPFCTPSDITSISGKYIEKTERNITSLGLAKSAGNLSPVGSLLLCSAATIGDVKIANRKVLTNQNITSLICHSVDNEFMYYKFLTLKDQILKISIGSTFLLLTKKDIACFKVDIPTLEEQKAIAAALSDVDSLIDSLEQLINKKHDMKKAMMQQLLTGKKRLPDFAAQQDDESNYKQTDIGLIPKDWEVVLVGDLFDFKNGLNKAKEFFGYGTPIVNYMDVFKLSGLRFNNIQGKVNVTFQEKQNFSVKKGDVFFTRTSETVEEIGIASVMLEDCNETVFSGFVLRSRPKSKLIKKDYCQYCFSSDEARKQIVSKSTYTTRALTNGRLLSSVILALPKPEEQKAIAKVLSDMDKEIDMLKQRLDKVRLVKMGMMQELLTGKTRLIKTAIA